MTVSTPRATKARVELTAEGKTLGVLGAMVVMPLLFWFARRQDPSPLYFGLFALTFGLGLALAPVGAGLAVSGRFSPTAGLLGAAVLTWVAGFDVLYACQDLDFDRRHGLHSVPARFGVRRALVAARTLHGVTVLALGAVGLVAGLHPVYWIGWLAVAAILIREHGLVRPGDLSRLDVAFFNMNGVLSVVYLTTIVAAVLLRRAQF